MTVLDRDQAYDLCQLLRRHRASTRADVELADELSNGFEEVVLRAGERGLLLSDELELSGPGADDARLSLLRDELTRLGRAWGLRYAPVVLHPTVRQRLSSLAL